GVSPGRHGSSGESVGAHGRGPASCDVRFPGGARNRHPCPAARTAAGARRGALAAMRIVLVTGGTGFIGAALVPRLIDAGSAPGVFARATPASVPQRVEIGPGEVSDPRQLIAAAAGAEAIVHLAAATSSGRLDPAVAYRVNVGAASALVEAS